MNMQINNQNETHQEIIETPQEVDPTRAAEVVVQCLGATAAQLTHEFGPETVAQVSETFDVMAMRLKAAHIEDKINSFYPRPTFEQHREIVRLRSQLSSIERAERQHHIPLPTEADLRVARFALETAAMAGLEDATLVMDSHVLEDLIPQQRKAS